MTSSDILDTCLATQIRDAGELIGKALREYRQGLAGLVERTRGIACMGRTHGMHAEPTTMALKMAGFLAEADRCGERLDRGLEEACRGKISGAVGTYAHLAPGVEEYVCDRLGIRPETVSTQVVPRDRHAAFLYALCSIGGALERFATEVRHLQRTEVGEAEERFGGGQKGSSAMPHKRNPIVSERLCGLARLMRGYLVVGLEDTALWHERDISHSSAERFVFPDACGVALYALRKGADLAAGLTVDGKAVRRNLKAAGDRFYSQSVMLALVDTGMSREEAYALVQRLSMEAMQQGRSLLEALLSSPELLDRLPEEKIREVCSLQRHLRNESAILGRLGLDG
jgi:adenylosuccinate lyase